MMNWLWWQEIYWIDHFHRIGPAYRPEIEAGNNVVNAIFNFTVIQCGLRHHALKDSAILANGKPIEDTTL